VVVAAGLEVVDQVVEVTVLTLPVAVRVLQDRVTMVAVPLMERIHRAAAVVAQGQLVVKPKVVGLLHLEVLVVLALIIPSQVQA
jgi:hypothetical protein